MKEKIKVVELLIVKNYLKEHRDIPIKISELKRKLSKKVMYKTLLKILSYLEYSGKIIIGTKGVQWIYAEPEHLKKMLEDSLEV